MLLSQRLTVQASELRQQLCGLAAAEDSTSEVIEAKRSELSAVEVRLRAAIESEGADNTPHDNPGTSEGREFGHLLERSSIADYIGEALFGGLVDGASKELREATLGDNKVGIMPMAALAPRMRADASTSITTSIEDSQESIFGRVFTNSIGAYLDVQTPSVDVGDVSYPRLVNGTTGDVRSPSVELDGTAATLEIRTISPVRLTASYTFSRESLARIRGFEEALTDDLRSVMNQKRDDLILNGQAAVSNVSPAVTGLLSRTTAGTKTGASDWADILALYDDAIDDKHARDADEIRLLTNLSAYVYARGLQVATSGQLLRPLLPADRFRGSAHMPDSASNLAQVIAYRSQSPSRGLISPTWRGIEVIVDPYSQAKAGQRIATIVAMVGFDAVDVSAFMRSAIRTA